MKYKAILFDLDGTLLNTIDDLADSMNIVLERKGFPTHDANKYRYFIGNGVYNIAKRALPIENRDEETIRICVEEMKQEYDKRLIQKTKPYEGIPELLDSIQSMNIKMSILSNKHDVATQLIVKKLLSNCKFEAVFGERSWIPRKPDPTGAMEISKALDVSPENFIYLGDSGVDMETAKAAGMYGVGALWGFRDADELKSSGAKALIKAPKDLLDILLD